MSKQSYRAGIVSVLLVATRVVAADITNQPPQVKIFSPPDGAVFAESSDILVLAAARDPDGVVQTVEFFADAKSLGVVTNPPMTLDTSLSLDGAANLGGATANSDVTADVFLDRIPINPFHLVWHDAPAGRHILTTVATDNSGASAVSAPVEILVLDHMLPSIVTVIATDPVAAEADSNTATFSIHRTGPTNADLVVNYKLGGSASNGIDFVELPSSITIPAGQRTAEVVAVPIDDTLVEGPETIILQLGPPPCPDPTSVLDNCYLIGRYDRAVAIIRDNDQTNHPPAVRILNPQTGEIFKAGSNIQITTAGWDDDGAVKSVEFFEGTNSLGIVTGPVTFRGWDDDPTFRPIPGLPLYSLIWSNVPPGDYVLTAVATDDQGANTISGPIKIKTIEATPPPVVTIKATDPDASEPNPLSATPVLDTATFTVSRSGPTNSDLTVYFRIGGTAVNGVDYREVPHKVTLPAGELAADIVVSPIDDLIVEGDESVVLALIPPPCITVFPPPADFYVVGDPGWARAVIHDTVIEQQHQPIVTIFARDATAAEQSPLVDAAPDTATFVVHRSGGDLTSPLTVYYRVAGTASNGIDYDKLPGEVTIPAQSETAEIVVNPIDDDESEGTESVVLKLLPGYPPCLFATPPCEMPMPSEPTYFVGFPAEAVALLRDNDPANVHARVAIIKPQAGNTFDALSDIEIDVRALDPDGWVHTVEFFANGVKIGQESVEFIQAPPPGQEQMFSLIWSNVTTGKYILTAQGTDNLGAATRSDPVTIAVGDVTPLVPVVSVVATDPFASEVVSTNGTNTATFRIFRSGPTNLDLTVFYSMQGTASNGVDYADVGNAVTIVAGRHSAKVVIVPIDDNLEEGVETAVLKIEPDRSLGPVPRYEVGRPETAFVVIVDNDVHRLSTACLPDGSFHLCVDRPDGFAFRLEASDDLSVWVSLCTNVVTDGALRFVDPDSREHRHRFYRNVPQSNYVPEE